LNQKQLPHHLWGAAVSAVAYIFKRCVTKRLKDKVYEEVWSGKKPFVRHLKYLSLYASNTFLMQEGRN